MKYTKESLLEEAIKRYPMGTHVVSTASSGYKGIIKNHSPLFWKRNELWFSVRNCNIKIYDGKNWAIITKLPILNYEIY